ncbi:MAG: carbohydrate ABC transporter permease [Oscillospiraceae bacterium]
MNTQRLSKWDCIRGLLCIAVGIAIAFPVLYGLSMSLMRDSDILAFPPKLFPASPTLENYVRAVTTVPIFRFILNSVIVSLCVCAGQVLTCSLAAFAFVFYDFRGKQLLFLAVLATMMIPGEATIISNFLTISSLELNDTFAALILPYLTSAMGIFLIRQFYLTVPKELREAAQIDGCTGLQFFAKIIFPISSPILGALSVYTVIGTWNQYMWPLLVTNTPERRTVQIGISMLQFSDGISVGLVNAGCMMILLPSILFYALGQKKMVTSLTAGAVKG